ncbi:MAG: urease accessory protein UreD [Zavarzinia sp.]|nr:urease accessory protein UreD [Zavarzinia sp.]
MKPRFAATSWSEDATPKVAALARAEGTLEIAFRRRGEATVLDHLYQQGCAKARFPKVEASSFTTAVTLNTSGGLTDGDRLSTHVRWGEGTAATVASQAAERAYRAMGDVPARLDTHLAVAAGASAEWLPQETILFDGARLHRDLRIDVAGDASFLGLEQVIFGRTARGEVVRDGAFRDAWRVWRDGRLIYADVFALKGDMQARLDGKAVAQGAIAAASIIHVAPDAAERLAEVRNSLGHFTLWGASADDGMLMIRLLGETGAALRRMVLAALAPLRGGRPVPKVWQI